MRDLSLKVVLNLVKTQFSEAIAATKAQLGEFTQSADGSAAGIFGIQQKAGQAARSMLDFGGAARSFLAGFSVLAIGAGIKNLIGMADNLRLVEGRIKNASDGAIDFSKNYAQLAAISYKTATSFEENANVFARINPGIKEMGGNSQDTLRQVDLLAKSLRISNATQAESASIIRQWSQAMASGVVRGDEFNSIMENAPRIQQALAASLGVSVGELRGMAEAGELTSARVAAALAEQGSAIDEEFKKIPLTIGAAFEKIKTSFGQYAADTDKSTEATASFAGGIQVLADNLTAVLDTALALGKVVAVIFAGNAIAGLSSYIAMQARARAMAIAHSEALQINMQRNAQLAAANVASIQAEIAALRVRDAAYLSAGANTDALRIKTQELAAAKLAQAEADAALAASNFRLGLGFRALLSPMNLLNLAMVAMSAYMVGEWLRSFETVRTSAVIAIDAILSAVAELKFRLQEISLLTQLKFTFDEASAQKLRDQLGDLEARFQIEGAIREQTKNEQVSYEKSGAPAQQAPDLSNIKSSFNAIDTATEDSGKKAEKVIKAKLDASLSAIKTEQEAAKNKFDIETALAESQFKADELALKQLSLSEGEFNSRSLALKRSLDDHKLKIEADYLRQSHALNLKAIDEKIRAEQAAISIPKPSSNSLAGLIAGGESHGSYNAFNRGTSGNTKLPALRPENLTELTLGQIQARQALSISNEDRLGAVGKYQIVRDTLKEAIAALKLSADTKFDAATQEKIFSEYLVAAKRKPLQSYIKGQSNDINAAQESASLEFAAIENPTTQKSSHDGKGGNKSSIVTADFRQSANAARESYASNISDGQDEKTAYSNAVRGNGGSEQQASGENIKALQDQRLAEKADFNAKLKLLGIEEANNTIEQSTEQLAQQKAKSEEQKALDLVRLDSIRNASLDELSLKEAMSQQELTLGEITQSEHLKRLQNFSDNRIKIEQDFLTEKRKLLSKDTLALAQNLADQEALIRKAGIEKTQQANQQATEQEQAFNATMAPFENAVDQMTNGVLTGQQTIGRAVKNAAANMLTSYASTFIKERAMQAAHWAWTLAGTMLNARQKELIKNRGFLMTVLTLAKEKVVQGAHWVWEKLGFATKEATKTTAKVVNEGIQTGAQVAGDATRTVSTVAAEKASKQATAETTMSKMINYAVQAAAAVYASVATIPYVGWILAPVAAAATFAGVMAFGAMASFAKGGEMEVGSDNAPYFLHKRESVLPAGVADNFRKVVNIVNNSVGGDDANQGASIAQPVGIQAFNEMVAKGAIPASLNIPSFANNIVSQSQNTASRLAQGRHEIEQANQKPSVDSKKSGGGDIYNIHAIDSQSFEKYLSNKGPAIAKVLSRENRKFNKGNSR